MARKTAPAPTADAGSTAVDPARKPLAGLVPGSLSVELGPFESDGDRKLLLRGEVQIDPTRRYESLRIAVTAYASSGEVLLHDDSALEMEWLSEDRMPFSISFYLTHAPSTPPTRAAVTVRAKVLEATPPFEVALSRRS